MAKSYCRILLAIFILLTVILDHVVGRDTKNGAPSFNLKNSKPVSAGKQKIVSMAFGCPGLDAGDANITCTQEKVEKRFGPGLDCAENVPLKTQALFLNCPPGYAIVEDYKVIVCKFPGKWDKDVFTCEEIPTTEATTTTTKKLNVTTTTKKTTTKPKTTTKVTTTKPLVTTKAASNATTTATNSSVTTVPLANSTVGTGVNATSTNATSVGGITTTATVGVTTATLGVTTAAVAVTTANVGVTTATVGVTTATIGVTTAAVAVTTAAVADTTLAVTTLSTVAVTTTLDVATTTLVATAATTATALTASTTTIAAGTTTTPVATAATATATATDINTSAATTTLDVATTMRTTTPASSSTTTAQINALACPVVPAGYKLVADVGLVRPGSSPKSRADATTDCTGDGGFVLNMDSEFKHTYLSTIPVDVFWNNASNKDQVWVGIESVSGFWKSVQGILMSSMPYIKWAPGRPVAGRCGIYFPSSKTHYDSSGCTDATRLLPYICEKPYRC